VQLSKSQHYLDGKLPDCLLIDGFAHLAFYKTTQVALNAILHDDEQLVVLCE
jgi:hypothetical protein